MRIVGTLALLFGLVTVLAGGRALFGGELAREAVGAAVPFVLWFNFLAGFAYAAAGVGLLLRSPWAAWLSVLIAAASMLVFIAFGVHVFQGGAFETRTVGAMALRCLVWGVIAFYSFNTLVVRQTRARSGRGDMQG